MSILTQLNTNSPRSAAERLAAISNKGVGLLEQIREYSGLVHFTPFMDEPWANKGAVLECSGEPQLYAADSFGNMPNATLGTSRFGEPGNAIRGGVKFPENGNGNAYRRNSTVDRTNWAGLSYVTAFQRPAAGASDRMISIGNDGNDRGARLIWNISPANDGNLWLESHTLELPNVGDIADELDFHNDWEFVVVTWDESGVSWYYPYSGSSTTGGSEAFDDSHAPATSTQFAIGQGIAGNGGVPSSSRFEGAMAMTAVYDRALTPVEAQRLIDLWNAVNTGENNRVPDTLVLDDPDNKSEPYAAGWSGDPEVMALLALKGEEYAAHALLIGDSETFHSGRGVYLSLRAIWKELGHDGILAHQVGLVRPDSAESHTVTALAAREGGKWCRNAVNVTLNGKPNYYLDGDPSFPSYSNAGFDTDAISTSKYGVLSMLHMLGLPDIAGDAIEGSVGRTLAVRTEPDFVNRDSVVVDSSSRQDAPFVESLITKLQASDLVVNAGFVTTSSPQTAAGDMVFLHTVHCVLGKPANGGKSISILESSGGQSSFDVFKLMAGETIESLAYEINAIREGYRQMGLPPQIFVIIEHGHNDQNENAVFDHRSVNDYIRNNMGCLDTVVYIYELFGWPLEELHLLFFPDFETGNNLAYNSTLANYSDRTRYAVKHYQDRGLKAATFNIRELVEPETWTAAHRAGGASGLEFNEAIIDLGNADGGTFTLTIEDNSGNLFTTSATDWDDISDAITELSAETGGAVSAATITVSNNSEHRRGRDAILLEVTATGSHSYGALTRLSERITLNAEGLTNSSGEAVYAGAGGNDVIHRSPDGNDRAWRVCLESAAKIAASKLGSVSGKSTSMIEGLVQ